MKRIIAYIIVMLCVTALSACSLALPFFPQPTATPTSTATRTPLPTSTPMPPFQGTLLVRTTTGYQDVGVYKLTYDASTWTILRTPVVEGVGGAILSSDGNHLFIYQGEDSPASVIDLLTGEKISFAIPEGLGDMTSISLSPDNTAFCYATSQGRIYLYNISLGKTWTLHKAPSADYSFEGGTQSTVHGDARCGLWLTADRFVIYRYVGSMPRQITFPGYPEVQPNVTTIVTSGEKPKFEDVKHWFFVEAVSQDGLSIVYTDKQTDSFYLARTFSSFKKMEPQLIAQPTFKDETFFAFLPNDQLLYEWSIDYSLINLADMKFSKWDLPNDCGNGQEYVNGVAETSWDTPVYHSSWQWIGEPGSNRIACVYYPGLNDVSEVYIAELASGSITSIYTWKNPQGLGKPFEIIGWLPDDYE